MQEQKIKVAIVTSSLAHGGAERSSALLSVLLSDLGYEVHIITVLNEIEYQFKGELLNLGALKNKNDSTLGRFNRLLVLRKYLKKHNFHRIIDNRTRQSSWSEWIISRLTYPAKKAIYVVRSSKISDYFPHNQWIARHIYCNSPYIVAVSDAMKAMIEAEYHYSNVIRIYNPIAVPDLFPSPPISQPFIIAYGRIDDEVKNYTLMIEAYAESVLPQQNIQLVILGDGKDTEKLQSKVKSMNLSTHIVFKPKMTNPFSYVKAALFTVLTSRYEGFPRVLIESLSLGTPVVSVDCVSGPSEIVQNGVNGLLVENFNVHKLTAAMNRFVEDAELYDICKMNAAASVAHLSPQTIGEQWHQILSQK